ncbi:MAG: UDP-glucose--dolichyl-phosphate glucosyltransferase [Verrucomicrobia bacterium]|nr:UDP-glucose--dolichyl-phosphate glucosyltransferase [Verrucomicrobiota bacterium]
MFKDKKIVVIIPAFNEENAVGKVIQDIPTDIVDEVIVVNNNSTDRTSESALKEGATVLFEERKGYGNACLKGMEYVENEMETPPDILIFIDADYSDYPEQMPELIQPIASGEAQLVIGSRAIGKRDAGSMTVPQLFGNWLATRLIRLLYGIHFTDLGPFRAIDYPAIKTLDMQDKTYGWTVEMQVKAAKYELKCKEVPVNYRQRIGFSKISGTVKGTLMAGYKIITTIFKYL